MRRRTVKLTCILTGLFLASGLVAYVVLLAVVPDRWILERMQIGKTHVQGTINVNLGADSVTPRPNPLHITEPNLATEGDTNHLGRNLSERQRSPSRANEPSDRRYLGFGRRTLDQRHGSGRCNRFLDDSSG